MPRIPSLHFFFFFNSRTTYVTVIELFHCWLLTCREKNLSYRGRPCSVWCRDCFLHSSVSDIVRHASSSFIWLLTSIMRFWRRTHELWLTTFFLWLLHRTRADAKNLGWCNFIRFFAFSITSVALLDCFRRWLKINFACLTQQHVYRLSHKEK